MSLTQRIAAAAVPPDAVAIFWIGQGGFVFKTAEGAIIYADPYLSNSCQSPRLVEIPIAPEEVRADLVLMTHDHLDHTDPETLPHIARSSSAVFAGPESSCLHLQELGVPADRTVAMAPGDQRRLAGTLVGAVFARHTEDSLGFVLDFGGPTVYLTGDTEYDGRLEQATALPPTALLVCINGKLGNMTAAEAARLAAALRPRVVIPMHYGLFADNTADPQDFVRLAQAHAPQSAVILLALGEPFLLRA